MKTIFISCRMKVLLFFWFNVNRNLVLNVSWMKLKADTRKILVEKISKYKPKVCDTWSLSRGRKSLHEFKKKRAIKTTVLPKQKKAQGS